ncbi:MAG: hypothetical protein ABI559_12630 [Chloroflexota bacterium]
MPRIRPVEPDDVTPEQWAALEAGETRFGRMTNMKRTLLRAPVGYDALMMWYDLRDVVQPWLGERLTVIFSHAISSETDCLICSTFFRRILIDWGDDPDVLTLDEREQLVVDFGRALSTQFSRVPPELYKRLSAEFSDEQIVALTSFGAMMVATNIVNNALEVELDEYLGAYRAKEDERAR